MAAAEPSKLKPRLDGTIAFNELTVGKKIGFGSFGHVFTARHNGWNCVVAYKKLKLDLVDPDENTDEAKYA